MWTTKKQDPIDALDEMSDNFKYADYIEELSEQIGKLRSLVDHLPQDNPVVKHFCNTCDHLSDRHHEINPLGEWKWCNFWQHDVHEDTMDCRFWAERVLTWPEDK